MDWIDKFSNVLDAVEENLTNTIDYESLARILHCSVYEFSRIFSFVANVSVSEYIRNRRISQAVLDIKDGEESIVTIALKYGYESQSSFSRAFKELQGVSPGAARKPGITLTVYPRLSFKLITEGVKSMKFRIEKKESFKIMGLKGYDSENSKTPIWDEFMTTHNPRLYNGGSKLNVYKAPFWQVAAYDFESKNGRTACIIGAEVSDDEIIDDMDTGTVPKSDWVVFSITSKSGCNNSRNAHMDIIQWFSSSRFVRDTEKPSLEVYPPGNASSDGYVWEIWMPTMKK